MADTDVIWGKDAIAAYIGCKGTKFKNKHRDGMLECGAIFKVPRKRGSFTYFGSAARMDRYLAAYQRIHGHI